jgi:glucan endo-1,3-alpha-glucosidase
MLLLYLSKTKYLNRLWFLLALLCSISISSHAQQKMVFAHYMVCNRSYGNGKVTGYIRDIKEAQAMGVDGFALNIGGWGANDQENVRNLFQAASELGTCFNLFFSIDQCCGLSHGLMLKIIQSYIKHPNYFYYNSRPFLSAWTGGGGIRAREYWINNILKPLKDKGYNMYFIPFMFTTENVETPAYNTVLSNYNIWWKGFLDGYFYFGAAGLPSYAAKSSTLKSGEAFSKVFHDHHLTFMASVSPLYWGGRQKNAGRRYFEYQGGKGIAEQWKSIIEVQKPEWVELVTWNDWDEATYFSPMDDINKYWPWNAHKELGFYKTHKGFAALNSYYINWYKSGKQPEITEDQIYFFYRTHSKDTISLGNVDVPVRGRIGVVKDEIFITTMLKEPAALRVLTGIDTLNYQLDKGIVHTRVPFRTGPQYFEISRNGARLIYERGEDIRTYIRVYNYNFYSGYGSAK